MEEEIFRPIPNYEGIYEVSNLGNVYALNWARKKGVRKILKPTIGTHGYPYISLSKNGKPIKRLIHQLVLEAFVGNYTEKECQIRHLDGDRKNPRLNNLKYGTPTENGIDTIYHMTNASQKLTPEQVLEIYKDNRKLKDIAKDYGVTNVQVSYIKTGREWGHLTGQEYKRTKPHSYYLTEEEILAIFKDNRKHHVIAKDYEIPITTVRNIKYGNRGRMITQNISA